MVYRGTFTMNLLGKKITVHPSIQWFNKDVGLWLNLFIPQKPMAPRLNNTLPSASTGSYKRHLLFVQRHAMQMT